MSFFYNRLLKISMFYITGPCLCPSTLHTAAQRTCSEAIALLLFCWGTVFGRILCDWERKDPRITETSRGQEIRKESQRPRGFKVFVSFPHSEDRISVSSWESFQSRMSNVNTLRVLRLKGNLRWPNSAPTQPHLDPPLKPPRSLLDSSWIYLAIRSSYIWASNPLPMAVDVFCPNLFLC